jgi:hypothetical protein
MDTEPFREALQPEPLDFTEWETRRLRDHLGGLLVRAEFANQRQYPGVEREINVATFELCSRRADYERFQGRVAQHVGQTAVEGV